MQLRTVKPKRTHSHSATIPGVNNDVGMRWVAEEQQMVSSHKRSSSSSGRQTPSNERRDMSAGRVGWGPARGGGEHWNVECLPLVKGSPCLNRLAEGAIDGFAGDKAGCPLH